MAPRDEDRLMTVKEAAAWLNVSVPTTYRLLRRRHLKGTKVGGQWRVAFEALRNYLKQTINVSSHTTFSQPKPHIADHLSRRNEMTDRRCIVAHTLQEVAENLGLELEEIEHLVELGVLESILVDGRKRVTCDAVIDFLEGKRLGQNDTANEN